MRRVDRRTKLSLEPVKGAARVSRRGLTTMDELVLVFLPTATILLVLAFVEVLTAQRLLFSSLASSAFLIYLDPQHGTNSVRTLLIAQPGAALLGWLSYSLIGTGFFSDGTAIVLVIVLMIFADAVHPPAVATALSFAFRAGNVSNLGLFGLAVAVTALLVVLERGTMWLLVRYSKRPGRNLPSAHGL